MKTLKSGDKKIDVRANNLARLFYMQEFDKELDLALAAVLKNDGDLIQELLAAGMTVEQMTILSEAFSGAGVHDLNDSIKGLLEQGFSEETVALFLKNTAKRQNKTRFPAFEAMKIIWAMNKAERIYQDKNCKTPKFIDWLIEYADFDVNDCPDDFMEEVNRGFFRISTAAVQQ